MPTTASIAINTLAPTIMAIDLVGICEEEVESAEVEAEAEAEAVPEGIAAIPLGQFAWQFCWRQLLMISNAETNSLQHQLTTRRLSRNSYNLINIDYRRDGLLQSSPLHTATLLIFTLDIVTLPAATSTQIGRSCNGAEE
jgi:hypothetical protein